jgi:hypothetical protein
MVNDTSRLARLQDWFLSQCDGGWEHENGIRIETLDNPGWLVQIDLEFTPLQGRAFPDRRVEGERGDEEWYECRIDGTRFVGAGGARALDSILEVFLDWAAPDREGTPD